MHADIENHLKRRLLLKSAHNKYHSMIM